MAHTNLFAIQVALFSLVTLSLVFANPSIISLSHTSFSSCAASTGDGNAVINFRINVTGFTSVVNCTFVSGSNTIYFSGLLSGDEVLCLTPSLEAGEYMVGVSTDTSTYFYNNQNITISKGLISDQDSFVNVDRESYLAGEDIIIEVASLTSCGTKSDCENGKATFSVNVQGMPQVQSEFLTQTDNLCRYKLPLFKKGSFNYSVLFNETEKLYDSVLEIGTGITTVNNSMSSLDSSNITSITSGKTSCFSVNVLDTYLNTVEELELFQFEIEWENQPSIIIENPFLHSSSNGTYKICFDPSSSGKLNLVVKINGVQITGSPSSVNILPGLFDSQNSLIRDSTICPSNCQETASSTAIAGERSSLIILPRDKFQNEKTDISDINIGMFIGNITSGSNTFSLSFEKQGNNVFAVFNATIVGSYNFYAKYDGVLLDNGRIPVVNIIANSVSFSASSLTSSGSSSQAGVAIITTLNAFDSYGNSIAGDSSWTSQIRPTSGNAISCTVTNPSTNQYQSRCNATLIGLYTIVFQRNGSEFPQTRTIEITPSGVSGVNSKYGGYLTTVSAGNTSDVVIYTYDRFGNVGGSILPFQKFLIQVEMEENGSVTQRVITDQVRQGGSSHIFISNFTLTVAGKYTISVFFSGSPLTSLSSRTIQTQPSNTKGSFCTLTLKSPPTAATLLSFELQARDRFQNLQTVNELDKFSVQAKKGDQTINCAIETTNINGVYNVTFTPVKSGVYEIFGLFNQLEPFSITSTLDIKPGPISSSTTTVVSTSTGHAQAEAGAKTLILIQGRDAGNNRVEIGANSNSDDYNITITSQGSKRAPTVIVPQKENSTEAQLINGISVYSYTINVAGTYTLSIQKNGIHISGSPSNLVVSSASSLSTSTVEGPESMKVGETINLVLTMVDSFGNPVDGKDTLGSNLIGVDNGAIVRLQPQFQSGKYTMQFTPEIGGRYNLVLTWNNSPLQLTKVIDVFSNEGGTCTNFDGPINQGKRWELVCIAFDDYGKEEKAGGATINVEAPGGKYTVTDRKDGSYLIAYSSQRIGKRTVTITINNKTIKDMPLTVAIIPGAVVLGTVIPSMFIFGVILVMLFIYWRKRKQREEMLLKKKRKPQQVFQGGDFEDEWSDEEENGEEENWFSNESADQENQIKLAHEMTMKSLSQE